MSKRKIMTMALAVCMVAILAVGGTLAFLTDTDNAVNTFTVGNIKIDLKEYVGVKAEDGEVKMEEELLGEDVPGIGADYENLMPGNEITKRPIVTNTGDFDAYVRIAVTMNNAWEINEAIDQVYEGRKLEPAAVQAVYDEVFNGWGINYNPRPDADDDMNARGIIEKANYPTITGAPSKDAEGNVIEGQYEAVAEKSKVIAVDFVKVTPSNDNPHYIFGLKNWFQGAAEQTAAAAGKYEVYGDVSTGYYTDDMEDFEIRYVYYVRLAPGESVTLFEGLNVPSDFDQNVPVYKADGTVEKLVNQLAMFDELNIEIDVAAIQADGFEVAGDKSAFIELEKVHPLTVVTVNEEGK